MKQTNQKIWRISSVLTLILFLFVSISHAQAPLPTFSQGVFSAFPLNNQLYPRILPVSVYSNGYANVVISGTMNQGTFNGVRVRVLRDPDGAGPSTYVEVSGSPIDQSINTGSSSANFSIQHQLPSELFNYRYEFYGLNGSTQSALLASANQVVSGDTYIINGQSNAEASSWCPDGSNWNLEPNLNFIRTYGTPTIQPYSTMVKQWYIATGTGGGGGGFPGYVGSWGIRLASRITDLYDIPVAIFNGAFSYYSSYFTKTSTEAHSYGANDNNYWRLLRRVQEAGLTNGVRSLIWWQGETDMGSTIQAGVSDITSKADYKAFLNNIHSDWRLDFPSLNKVYLIQVRRGCFNQAGGSDDSFALDIMQAQREFVLETMNTELIATNGVDQLGGGLNACHYCYSGYSTIAERILTIVRQNNYGLTVNNNTRSFGPIAADFTGVVNVGGIKTQIGIRLQRPNDSYYISETGGTLFRNNLQLNGSGNYTIVSTSIDDDVLLINFSRSTGDPDPTSVSFFGHASGLKEGTVNNGTSGSPGGGSLFSFQNFPIVFGALPADPLSLTVSRNGNSNTLRWKAESNERFDQFVIEKGETRNSFKSVQEIYGTGQEGTHQYDFTDNKPNAIVTHYRIRAMQMDGRELFSQVVTVNNRLNTVKEFRVYPNPVAGSANATINMNEAAMATINLHDASGRLLSSRKLQLQKGNNQFSVGELLDYNPGTYIVRVVTATETQQIRVVKAK